MESSLSGKTFVVTGATSGIGLAAAELLVRQGAFVIGVGRSAERCREAERKLWFASPDGKAEYRVADLSLQSQVRALAAEIGELLARRGRSALDGLINDAGTFTYWLTLTQEGFEMQWAVNHLAAFLLTHELLPLLKATPAASSGAEGRLAAPAASSGAVGPLAVRERLAVPGARVVTVSSDSHFGVRLNWEDIQLRRNYNGLRAYGQTKLANVLFTLELNRRLGENSTVRAFAADPGLVKTDIGLKNNPALVRWVWARRRSGGVAPEESAKGIVFLATEPSIQDSPEIYWKDSAPKPASRYAMDGETARRLWALSEQMCGVHESEEVENVELRN